jgi:hypothetical protein
MSTGYQIKDQEALHDLTLLIVDWIDIFIRKVNRDIVLESISYCKVSLKYQRNIFIPVQKKAMLRCLQHWKY